MDPHRLIDTREPVGRPEDSTADRIQPTPPDGAGRLRICLVGDFSEKLDEGYKNTSFYLARELEENDTVLRLNVKRLATPRSWRRLVVARPQIIHTIAQPTNQSLMFTHLLRQAWPRARTVISALRPECYFVEGKVSQGQHRLIHLARPDLVLAQSSAARRQFEKLGCTAAELPNGVDLERFRPATEKRKRQLRRQRGLDPDRPVVLHVGHLQAARNLMALGPLPQAGIQVVIAGSTYMGTNHTLIAQLEKAGFHVLAGYQPRVEELFMLADCYVFPPQPGDSLTMPLSVLEAMACNLRVVTTRFRGLEEAFEEGHGLRFVDSIDSIETPGALLPHVQEVLASPIPPATRRMVSAYSWQSVVHRLQGHYRGLLTG